ncbi:MAG: hypothetical protein HC869_21560 [Rhodospirillales bacterium]|nr:hypothetical protein [Rhodospirillales bacterium]
MAYKLDAQYEARRTQALSMKASSFQPGLAHGVIVDIGYPEAVVTVAALGDGRVGVWFSDGGGTAGSDEQTAQLGNELGLLAGALSHAMPPTNATPLPRPGEVKFYVLLNDLTRVASGMIDDLGQDRSQFSPLFHAAFRIINDLKVRNLVLDAKQQQAKD